MDEFILYLGGLVKMAIAFLFLDPAAQDTLVDSKVPCYRGCTTALFSDEAYRFKFKSPVVIPTFPYHDGHPPA